MESSSAHRSSRYIHIHLLSAQDNQLTNPQTFFNGITAFKALGRPYFGIHQAAIFPVYFSIQSFLPWMVILTSHAPGRTRKGLISTMSPSISTTSSGWSSRLNVPTSLSLDNVYATMAFVSLTGLVNLILFRPLTASSVKAKRVQGMYTHKHKHETRRQYPDETRGDKS